jgi:signal transduction histidine kinase
LTPDEQILKQEKIIADLTAQLSRKNKEVEIILKISTETKAALAVNKIAITLLASMAEIFGFNHSMILLLEEDLDILRVVATYGYESHGVGSTIQVGQGVIGVVAQKKKLMRISNLIMQRLYMQRVLSKDDETQPEEKIPLPGLPNSASQVAIPMLNGDELVGVLAVESPQSNFFNKEDEVLVSILANQAAIAFQNARLNQNLQIANATLQEYSDILEHKVEERTQELSQALEHLKATQHQLVEAEKMAALGSLVAGVAHEINTPLGIGVTAASLLEDKTVTFREIYQNGQMKRSDLEKYLDTARQSSQMILNNLNRAAELVQSFKEVAVDQSSEVRRSFRVKAYLEEVLLSLHPKLKRTQLAVELQADENLTLDSYPGAFAQIVTNLVMNSLIHAYEPDDKGQLTFEFKQQNDRFIFEYNDDGRGIPPENLAKIFEPFFTTRRGQGGSGLGLHIIYNLVTQKLGGQIRCESEVGKGTRFTIEISGQSTIVSAAH